MTICSKRLVYIKICCNIQTTSPLACHRREQLLKSSRQPLKAEAIAAAAVDSSDDAALGGRVERQLMRCGREQLAVCTTARRPPEQRWLGHPVEGRICFPVLPRISPCVRSVRAHARAILTTDAQHLALLCTGRAAGLRIMPGGLHTSPRDLLVRGRAGCPQRRSVPFHRRRCRCCCPERASCRRGVEPSGHGVSEVQPLRRAEARRLAGGLAARSRRGRGLGRRLGSGARQCLPRPGWLQLRQKRTSTYAVCACAEPGGAVVR